eukprot:TRINITY_DN21143_c0_g1_i1.p1 TRINITY_DN21143_c0_g1~~TRINITY_DN21143_c0_g1_i1.p1  ORF type:complete len:466 (-),score=108.16 TRINITY_DN21143_c0_g1_i1:214-1611(-)
MMDYGDSDSSATDDDFPSHPSQIRRRKIPRSDKNVMYQGGSQSDMESEIHNLEKEAYSAVLRAFNAQSDSISWAKEGLISDLRKELRVSDTEHRELLAKVNMDSVIKQIRYWRQTGCHQPLFKSNVVSGAVPAYNSSVSGLQKKQQMSYGYQQPSSHIPSHSSAQLPSSPYVPSKHRVPPRSKSQKSKVTEDHIELIRRQSGIQSQMQRSLSVSDSEQIAANRVSAHPPGKTHLVTSADETLIGRRLMIKWPEDNNFYEAMIANFHPESGTHLLVYGMNTPDETHEWVNMKLIPPSDMQWIGPIPMGFDTGTGNNQKKPSFKGRESFKDQSLVHFYTLQSGKNGRIDIELRHTEKLLKEVERIVEATYPDPADLEKAKEVLKEQELSLLEAIEKLSEVSDGCSEEQNLQSSRTHSIDHGWTKNELLSRNEGNSGDEYDTEEDDRQVSAGPFAVEGDIDSDNMQDD